MKPNPTILVHSGWNRYNFGDVAHTPGLLRLLERYIPEADILLWMWHYPEWLADYIGQRFPNVRTFYGEWEHRVSNQIDPVIDAAFDEADLFIYNSGPIFNYGHEIVSDYIKHQGWRGFDWNATMTQVSKLYYARHKQVPFGIFGQSFIYFSPPADVVIPDIFSQASFLSTRETDSLRYLQSLGVNAPEMGFTPDAAWAFDLTDDAVVLPWLQKHGLEERRYLTATTRYVPAGVDEEQDARLQRRLWQQVITDWVEKTNLPVVLIPETIQSIQLNRQYIFEPLPKQVQAHVILDDALWTPDDEFWTPDQALSILSRAHSYVNVDHHGALIALAAGVPVIHPRQPQAGRKSWIYRDSGLEDWLFDLEKDEPSAVSGALLDIYDNYGAAQQRVEEAVGIVRVSHEERMMQIRELLNLPD